MEHSLGGKGLNMDCSSIGLLDGQTDGAFLIINLYIKNSYITEAAWRMYRHQVPSLLQIQM